MDEKYLEEKSKELNRTLISFSNDLKSLEELTKLHRDEDAYKGIFLMDRLSQESLEISSLFSVISSELSRRKSA